MSYREPIKRQPRLWFVALWFRGPDGRATATTGFYWAKESVEAVGEAISEAGTTREMCWFDRAICAEDFIEQEAVGPPKGRVRK